jgi:SAM-dependent methyltransferase
MWEFLKKERKEIIKNSENLLYFSPHQKLLEKIEREIDCVSLDIKHKPFNVKADIQNIPFTDCSFDMVICSHVLPQVRDDRAALEEIHRILDTGGISLLMVQQDEELAETKEDPSITTKAEKAREYGLDSRYRLYGNDFINRVSAAGFDVEKVPYGNKIPSEVAKKYGLVRNRYYDMDWVPKNFRGKPGRAENIYVCRK